MPPQLSKQQRSLNINRNLMNFTRKDDVKNQLVQKDDFIKKVHLNDSFFESEGTNSHLVKQNRFFRKLNDNKEKTGGVSAETVED